MIEMAYTMDGEEREGVLRKLRSANQLLAGLYGSKYVATDCMTHPMYTVLKKILGPDKETGSESVIKNPTTSCDEVLLSIPRSEISEKMVSDRQGRFVSKHCPADRYIMVRERELKWYDAGEDVGETLKFYLASLEPEINGMVGKIISDIEGEYALNEEVTVALRVHQALGVVQ